MESTDSTRDLSHKEGEFNKIHKRKVLFDHDGNPDDIVSLMIVLGMPNIDLIGVTITPADCYIDQALDLTLKVLKIYDRKIPCAEGHIEGSNPFPDEYRVVTVKASNLPIFLNQEYDKDLFQPEPAHEFIVKKLKESKEKVTVLLTGPATNLMAAIEIDPSIKDNIEEVVWMAGAVDVPGNVYKYDHDKSAEWNVYWDAKSAQKLFKQGLNMTIFPLDATNTVPLTKEFMHKLAKQREWNVSDICGQFYAITFFQSQSGTDEYYMWDTLCASYLGCEGMATFRKVELDVETKRPGLGRTKKTPGSGHWVNVADKVNLEVFYKYFLDSLKRNGKLTH
jgi:purine nucleosidase